MCGHDLLLLADRVEEAERVHPEAEHAKRCQREQAEERCEQHPTLLARRATGKHEERQHDASRQLHADSRRERCRGATRTWMSGGAEHKRAGEREHHQGVVVCATNREHEQHGVEPHEGRRCSR